MGTTNSKRSRSLLSGGRFALGVAVGVFCVIAVYLAADLFGTGFTRSELIEAIPALLTLLVALVSLLLSFHALTEQKLMRQAGTDPVVLVHLDNREDARIMSTLEITNVGAGAALNVRLELLTDISEFVGNRILTDFSSLTQTFRTIPQDHSISFNFGVGHKLLEEPLPPPIRFKVSYEDIEGSLTEVIQSVDVSELKQQRADEGLLSRQTKALEKTAKSLERMQGIRPLNVITQSKDQWRAEQKEQARELKGLLKEKK